MPSPIFVCGAECGIAAVGTLSSGTEHFSAISGTPAVVTSGPASMRSTRCYRFNASGTATYLRHAFATAVPSVATVVSRFYLYFASLPVANCDLYNLAGGSGTGTAIVYNATTGKITAYIGGSPNTNGFTPSTGVWYCIDTKSVFNTTVTVDFSVDGVAQTQFVGGAAPQSCINVAFGVASNTTADVYIDDIIVSGFSGDYPIGAGTVVGLYPNGDRTNSAANPTDGNNGHLYSATTDFGKGLAGGTALAAQNVESTSWQSLLKPLQTTTPNNLVANLLGAAGEHLVWTKDAMPVGAVSVNGVMVVVVTHSAAATANDFGFLNLLDLTTGSNVSSVFGDLSETTVTVPVFVTPQAPGSTSWTPAKLDAVGFFWGNSSDVNPDVYLDGVCLEVDYVPSVAVFIAAKPVQVRQALNRSAVI